jgi:hypothetical protein
VVATEAGAVGRMVVATPEEEAAAEDDKD